MDAGEQRLRSDEISEKIDSDNNEIAEEGEVSDATRAKRPRGIGGAPKSSVVWNFFRYNEQTDKTKCIVKLNDRRLCGTEFKGKWSSTLLKHLRTKHPNLKVDDMLSKKEEEKKRKLTQSKNQQMSLAESFANAPKSKSKKYSKSHPKQQKLDKLLAMLIGSTNIPTTYVERSEFKNFVHSLDSKYKLPSRQDLTEKVNDIEKNLMDNVKAVVDKTGCVSAVCIDLWTRKEYSACYVGVTGHFFDSTTNSIRRFLIGLETIDRPNTAEKILIKANVALAKWNLDLCSEKILRILTDGANVRDVTSEIAELGENETEIEEGDPNLEVETESFEDREQYLSRSIGRQKHLSRVDHQLSRILAIAIEEKDVDATAKELLEAMRKIISKIRLSSTATDYLIRNYKQNLINPAYHYYALKRFLELKDGIRQIIDQEMVSDVENLTPDQWLMAKSLHDTLELFADAIAQLEEEKYVTLSRVIPLLINLHLGLIDRSRTGTLPEVARKLRSLLNDRFAHIFDSEKENFEPIYAVSTLLDPSYNRTFNCADLSNLKLAAVGEVVRYLRQYSNVEEAYGRNETVQPHLQDGTSALSYLNTKITNSESLQGRHDNSSNAAIKTEIESYLKIVADHRHMDAFDFWQKQRLALPNLYRLATTILAVPATTAPAERLFSQAGQCLNNDRYRLNEKNLERELMFRFNKSFME